MVEEGDEEENEVGTHIVGTTFTPLSEKLGSLSNKVSQTLDSDLDADSDFDSVPGSDFESVAAKTFGGDPK